VVADCASGQDWFAIGRGALGVLYLRINAGADDAVVARFRQHVETKNGSFVVLRGTSDRNEPSSIAEPDRHLRAVMNAVKARFDPNNVLPQLP
jgi:hypothetical protein